MKSAQCVYLLARSDEKTQALRTPRPAGSAGRGPLCTLALRLFDKADVGDLRRALDQFMTHRESYLKEPEEARRRRRHPRASSTSTRLAQTLLWLWANSA